MINKLFIALVKAYQVTISPLIGPRCRYQPSCSQYAIEAIKVHGVLKGSFLAVRRVLRCHPGHPGGYDPVPGQACDSCRQHNVPVDHQDLP